MAESATRNVLFKLKVERDSSLKGALSTFAKEVTKTQADVSKMHATELDKRSKATEAAAKKEMNEWEKVAAGIDKQLNARTKAVEKQRDAEEKLGSDLAKQHSKWENDKARAMEDTARQAELLRNKSVAGSKQTVEGFKQGLEGVTSLARGFVLLGVAREKDLEVAVRALARFEAVAQVMRGTVNLIQGLTKAYGGYRAAVLAAAAANTALSASQAGTSAKGIATKVAEGVALGAGVKAATGGGAGAGAVIGAAAAFAPLIAVGVAGAAVLTGIFALIDKDFREGLFELIGITDKGADALNATVAKIGKDQARREDTARRLGRDQAIRDVRLEGAKAAATSRSGLAGTFGSDRQLGDLAARELTGAREGVRAASEAAEFNPQADSQESQIAATQRLVGALELTKEIEQDKLKILKEQQQTSLNRIKEELSGLKQQKDKLDDLIKTERSRLESAAERFIQLDPDKQAALVEAGQKAIRGDQLGVKDIAQLSGSGLKELEDIGRKQAVGLAKAIHGFEEISAKDEARVGELEAKRAKVVLDIEAKTKLEVEVKRNTENEAKQIAERLAPILAERDNQLINAILLKFQQEERDRSDQRIAASIAARGGN